MHVNVPRYRKNNGRSVGGERDERHKYADGLREGKKKRSRGKTNAKAVIEQKVNKGGRVHYMLKKRSGCTRAWLAL